MEWKNFADKKKYRKIITDLQQHIPEEWAWNSEYSWYSVKEYFQEQMRLKKKRYVKKK